MKQDRHGRPSTSARSPAPLVHAATRGLERRQEKVELQQSRGELFHVSDTTQTVLRFRVNPSGAVRAGGSSKTVRWNNVQTDAKRFPELDTVQAIARCEERLQELLERDDLTRLP